MEKDSVIISTRWILFASTIMLVYALLFIIAGLAGIFNGDTFFRAASQQELIFSYKSWGWIHLIAGVLLVISAGAMLLGRTWARMVAVVLIIVTLLLNILLIGAYPGWALLFIILDALLLLSLMVSGRRVNA